MRRSGVLLSSSSLYIIIIIIILYIYIRVLFFPSPFSLYIVFLYFVGERRSLILYLVQVYTPSGRKRMSK